MAIDVSAALPESLTEQLNAKAGYAAHEQKAGETALNPFRA